MKAVDRILFLNKNRKPKHGQRGVFNLVALPIIFILLISTSQGAFSQDVPDAPELGAVTWDIQVVDSNINFSNMTNRSLAYKSDGTPCVAYGGDHLYYSCYDYNTKSWSRTTVDPTSNVGQYAGLAFTNNSNPFISYYDEENRSFNLAYDIGAGWNTIEIDSLAISLAEDGPGIERDRSFRDEVSESLTPWLESLSKTDEEGNLVPLIKDLPGVGTHTSLAIDKYNRVHMAKVPIEKFGDKKQTGLWTSIAVDDSLKVHISYLSEKYDNLRYAKGKPPYTSDKWEKETVDGLAPYDRVGTFSSLALDSNDKPIIGYYDFSNNDLKVARLGDGGIWKITRVASEDDVGMFTSLAVDHLDNIHVSFYDATEKVLKYARYAGNSWKITKLQNVRMGYFSSIALRGEKPGIAYYDATRGKIMFLYKSSTGWKGPKTIAKSRNVGLSSSIAINNNNEPFISYFDSTRGYLKYARYYGGSWSKSVVTSKVHAGAFSSIDLAGNYKPKISFYESDNKDLKLANWKDTKWKFSLIDDSKNRVGEFVSMEIDTNGKPRSSYYDATDRNLKYAYKKISAGEWKKKTLDTKGDVGLYTSIALNSANQPFISYFDATTGDLKIVNKSPINAWVTKRVDTANTVGLFTSIALDSAERPNISYYDATNKDLRFAHWNGATWDIKIVDSTGAVGLYTSLAINPADNSRHICYFDSTNGDLKYANWTGATGWATEIVDNSGNVGMTCAIALNNVGQPAISYYDYTKGDLKFATSYVLPP